jgi:hypothetical protein
MRADLCLVAGMRHRINFMRISTPWPYLIRRPLFVQAQHRTDKYATLGA